MADDINIDPALSSHPPSSVASDLTPLASPALSPYNTPGPSSLRHSRHASPDIAVPAATASSSHVHVNGINNNTATTSSHSNNNNSSNGYADDVPVPQMHSEGAPPPLPPKPPVQTAGVKRKADDSNVMKCPYRESKKCKKEYKHKNAMRYHLEQAHHQEPDIQSHLSHYPPLPPSKKAKLLNSRLASGPSHTTNAPSSVKSSSSSSHRPTAAAPSTAASAPNPFFGLFTHGYVFSSAGLPFRPHERPIDALYYLNILSTAGIKSQQQRASERLMINALLNADFIKHLQDSVNTDYQRLDLLDTEENGGMVKAPVLPIQPSTSNNYSPYTKRDADSAILKLAKTLQDVGLGDGIDNAQYF